MKVLTKVLAGGVVAAGLFAAAPAAAQYYPGYPGYGYGNGGVIGSIINGVLGGGYNNYGYGGYGMNSQAVVNQCAAAVQQRINRDYGYAGYNGYNPYGGYGPYGGGYGAYGQAGGGARVLGISRIEPRSGGGLTVRGVATSGFNAGYGGYGYAGQGQVDLTWKCKTDYRGFISDIDVDRTRTNYGQTYSPYGYDYSQYGYRRY